jgi:hypothetical protein
LVLEFKLSFKDKNLSKFFNALAIETASFFEAREKDIVESATLLGNAQLLDTIFFVSTALNVTENYSK